MNALSEFAKAKSCEFALRIFGAALLVVLFGQSNAIAELVMVTDPNSPGGANNVTLDTETGLEWLDWTASTNISYNDMLTMLGPGETYEGWTHANLGQIQTLMNNSGLDTANFPGDNLNADGGASAGLFMGFIGSVFDNGVVANSNAISSESLNGQLVGVGIQSSSTISFVGTINRSASSALSNTGHALVRSAAVPEPTAFVMFGAAMTCLCQRRRRN